MKPKLLLAWRRQPATQTIGRALVLALALTLMAASASAAPFVYVVTSNQQFGFVDLGTGAFHQIGGLTPEGQATLVWGPQRSLYSLTFSGNLEKINPLTGETTVVGQTGLGLNAFALAEAHGKLYATDLNNNIYSVDPETGAAQIIRATGIPPDPAPPFSLNPDGTVNLCDESLYGFAGVLYATFDAFTLDPVTLQLTPTVDPALWRIDPATGNATRVSRTALNLGASVEVNGKFYAFRWITLAWTANGPELQTQIVTLNLANGGTHFVRTIDQTAGGIVGAVPAR